MLFSMLALLRYGTRQTSPGKIHTRNFTPFTAFPWEVLEVYSGPPKVGFVCRHWGKFTGTYEDNKGKGQLIEMFGFGAAVVNDKLQLCDVEVFYNAEDFIENLCGEKKVEDSSSLKATCPFAKTMAVENALAEKNSSWISSLIGGLMKIFMK